MGALQKDILEYKKQLGKGAIQKAYRGLMEYILSLRTHFNKAHPELAPSGIYTGYMDMTYFALLPTSLKERGLKIAIVFLHETFRFEVWLSGYNKGIQSKYWKFFKESGWSRYRLVTPEKGIDSILESILVQDPDFSDTLALTKQIEKGTLKFIWDVEEKLGSE